jgi:putative membrane protein
MRTLLKIILSALALMLWSQVLPGIRVDNFVAALVAVLVLAVVNGVVRPILTLLTLPLTFLTLGLFLIILNVFFIWLAALIAPGFEVEGFWTILLFGLLMGITQSAIDKALNAKA